MKNSLYDLSNLQSRKLPSTRISILIEGKKENNGT